MCKLEASRYEQTKEKNISLGFVVVYSSSLSVLAVCCAFSKRRNTVRKVSKVKADPLIRVSSTNVGSNDAENREERSENRDVGCTQIQGTVRNTTQPRGSSEGEIIGR